MAVTATHKSTKIVIKTSEGSQTISGCNAAATDSQLYTLAGAVANLLKNPVESYSKVVESTLVNE